MRIYIPATSTLIERLALDGELAIHDAYAVTSAVREWYEGDDEELEYIATTVAARASLSLLAEDPQALRRRVVLAVDHDGAVPLSNGHRAQVLISSVVRATAVAAALVDDADAETDVANAIALLPRVATDDDARFAVDQAQSHELLWFAGQELPFVF